MFAQTVSIVPISLHLNVIIRYLITLLQFFFNIEATGQSGMKIKSISIDKYKIKKSLRVYRFWNRLQNSCDM